MHRATVGLAAAALLAAGCEGRAEPARAGALNCPERQGSLRLSARDAVGCTYAGADGAVVTLARLTPRDGSADAALAALKAELKPLVPRRTNARSMAGGDDPVIVDSRADRIDIPASGPGGAEIDIRNDRAGQVRATFILSSGDAGPGGWRLAGYEARGPARGALTVATVKSRAAGHEAVFDDLRALVKRNAG